MQFMRSVPLKADKVNCWWVNPRECFQLWSINSEQPEIGDKYTVLTKGTANAVLYLHTAILICDRHLYSVLASYHLLICNKHKMQLKF